MFSGKNCHNSSMRKSAWSSVITASTANASDRNLDHLDTEYLLLIRRKDEDSDLTEASGNYVIRFDGFKNMKISCIVKLKRGNDADLLYDLNKCLNDMYSYVVEKNPKSIRSYYLTLNKAKENLSSMHSLQIATLRTFLIDGQNLSEAIFNSLFV